MRDVEYGCRNRRGQSYRACTMAPAGSGAVYCESSKCKGYARTIKEEQPCLICKKIYSRMRAKKSKKQLRQPSIRARRMANAAASLQQQAAISRQAGESSNQNAPAMPAAAMMQNDATRRHVGHDAETPAAQKRSFYKKKAFVVISPLSFAKTTIVAAK